MASAVHSICFSRNENIILCRESYSSSSKLFTRSGNWPHGDVCKVKLWSNSEGLRSNRFEQSRRNYFWMKSRASHLVLCRIENIDPVHNTEAKENALSPIAILLNAVKKWRQVPFMALAGAFVCMVLVVPSSDAVDTLKTFGCLLKECRMEFAKCISNPSCAANIACLETCNNRPDEVECEYKCGDMFENSVVHEFNQCAVSRKKCVPQKSDLCEFPVPNPSVLVKSFNIADVNGKWYITSGLNPTFDTFDCQLTEFHKESNKLVGKLSWRISTPDGGFFNKSTVQQFVQDPAHPGVLYNHDNEYLNYKDNWYILSSKIENKPDDYIFVYYRGGNDAWDGYGGGVVYTRSEVLPENIVPELEKAAKSIGRDFNEFIRTDNTCRPEPSFVEKMEKKAGEGGEFIIREVKEIEEGVEKAWEDEMTYFQRLAEGFKEQNQDGNSLRAW